MAVLALVVALWWAYVPVFHAGVDRYIAIHRVPSEPEMHMILADHRFTVWAVSRNARAFLQDPRRLFDAETCFPAEKSLALGEPVITLGLLGILPYQLTHDPELTYNMAVMSLSLIGGLAMLFLVRDWTGSAAAGLAAAIFYLFGRARLGEPVHPYVGDVSWLVLALLFAHRLFVRGWWRDAACLAGALALQIGTSVYPAAVSVFLGLPFAVWLVVRFGLDAPRALRLLPVAATVALAATFVASPYFTLESSGELPEVTQIFLHPRFFLAGGPWFQGWCRDILAIAGLLLPARTWCRLQRSPRAALVTGGVLCFAIALGPTPSRWFGWSESWNPWALVTSLLPPLRAVRTPGVLALGFDLVLDILAAFGIAGILHLLRRFGPLLPALALLALVAWEAARYQQSVAYEPYLIEPPADRIGFFAALEKKGNTGPMFEAPIYPFIAHTAERISLASYHRRQTSTCFASFLGSRTARLLEISRKLPDTAALLALHTDGFTTLVVHHDTDSWEFQLKRFLPETQREDGVLRMVQTMPFMTAYSIEPGRRPVPPAAGRPVPPVPAPAGSR